MSIFKVGLGSLAIALLAVVTGIQAEKAAAHEVICQPIGSGFQISVNNGQVSVLMIEDASIIRTSCEQIANGLEREINKQELTSLMLVAESRGREGAICVVRRYGDMCRLDGSNVLISISEEIDTQKFLASILTIRTETGDSDKKITDDSNGEGPVNGERLDSLIISNRTYYAKFGEALSSALSR